MIEAGRAEESEHAEKVLPIFTIRKHYQRNVYLGSFDVYTKRLFRYRFPGD